MLRIAYAQGKNCLGTDTEKNNAKVTSCAEREGVLSKEGRSALLGIVNGGAHRCN
jgi:hypothetical protein